MLTTFTQIVERINSYRGMPEGWDGYTAKAPNADKLNAALRFLCHGLMLELQEPLLQRFPPCWAVPTTDGGVQFSWNSDIDSPGDFRVLELQVLADDDFDFYADGHTLGGHGMRSNRTNLRGAIALVRWLCTGEAASDLPPDFDDAERER